MIELIPREEQKAEALLQAKGMGAVRNSIRSGKGNAIGFIGELLIAEALNVEPLLNATKDYDLVMPDGTTIDVKTKETSVVPRGYYDCSIAATSLHQECDVYVFARYAREASKLGRSVLFVCGWLPHDEYFSIARELKKGEQDGDNGYIVKADCFNVRIDQLRKGLPQ